MARPLKTVSRRRSDLKHSTTVRGRPSVTRRPVLCALPTSSSTTTFMLSFRKRSFSSCRFQLRHFDVFQFNDFEQLVIFGGSRSEFFNSFCLDMYFCNVLCVSLYVSLCFSVCVSSFLCLFLCMFLCMFLCLCLCLFLCLFHSMSAFRLMSCLSRSPIFLAPFLNIIYNL